MSDQTITLRINGKAYSIEADPYGFTAAELNAVERYAGMTVQEWSQKLTDTRVSSLAWTALAWIAVRRAGEFVRWDEFEDRVRLADLLGSIGDGSGVTAADVIASAAPGDAVVAPQAPAGEVLATADTPPGEVPAPRPAGPNRAARRTKPAKQRVVAPVPPVV
jgi:hypothetical protein